MLVASASTCFFCEYVDSVWTVVALGLLLGLCEGSTAIGFAYVPAAFFGRQHLGSVQAAFISLAAVGRHHDLVHKTNAGGCVCVQVGSGLGPPLLALSKDYGGSFTIGLFWLGAVQLVAAIVCTLVPQPQKRIEAQL